MKLLVPILVEFEPPNDETAFTGVILGHLTTSASSLVIAERWIIRM